jgi:hypothetical protein
VSETRKLAVILVADIVATPGLRAPTRIEFSLVVQIERLVPDQQCRKWREAVLST